MTKPSEWKWKGGAGRGPHTKEGRNEHVARPQTGHFARTQGLIQLRPESSRFAEEEASSARGSRCPRARVQQVVVWLESVLQPWLPTRKGS